MKTNFAGLLPDLNAGVFEEQINAALDDVASNVVTHRKKGKVVITLELKTIGDSHQVAMTHSLKAITPKARGQVTEETTTDTALHVGTGGELSLFPNVQTRMELGAGAATGARVTVADLKR